MSSSCHPAFGERGKTTNQMSVSQGKFTTAASCAAGAANCSSAGGYNAIEGAQTKHTVMQQHFESFWAALGSGLALLRSCYPLLNLAYPEAAAAVLWFTRGSGSAPGGSVC